MVRFTHQGVATGAMLFLTGLFKKVVLADSVAPVADGLFAAGQPAGAFAAWAGVVAYTLQIYFDFSGYSDMALGLSRLFNVRLPVNFDSPYQARSIVDFWRRWHISLSSFLRDYVYIPLGGNRLGRRRRYANLLATMLLAGLWHGAGWTFVAWGAWHGVLLVGNHLWSERFPGPPRFPGLAWAAMSFAFSLYVGHFGTYDRTYGSLGALAGFMTWIWLSLIVILLGAELNNELDRTVPKPTDA